MRGFEGGCLFLQVRSLEMRFFYAKCAVNHRVVSSNMTKGVILNTPPNGYISGQQVVLVATHSIVRPGVF